MQRYDWESLYPARLTSLPSWLARSGTLAWEHSCRTPSGQSAHKCPLTQSLLEISNLADGNCLLVTNLLGDFRTDIFRFVVAFFLGLQYNTTDNSINKVRNDKGIHRISLLIMMFTPTLSKFTVHSTPLQYTVHLYSTPVHLYSTPVHMYSTQYTCTVHQYTCYLMSIRTYSLEW